MSKPAHRTTDLCTGHSCYPPRRSKTGSPDVIINDKLAHRLGDSWNTHSCGRYGHKGETVTASMYVIINDKGCARIGDDVSCGSVIMTGSNDVIVD